MKQLDKDCTAAATAQATQSSAPCWAACRAGRQPSLSALGGSQPSDLRPFACKHHESSCSDLCYPAATFERAGTWSFNSLRQAHFCMAISTEGFPMLVLAFGGRHLSVFDRHLTVYQIEHLNSTQTASILIHFISIMLSKQCLAGHVSLK